MAPNDGERKAGKFRTQCGCPRPSEGHALARRELQRHHPEAGGGKRLKTGDMQRGGGLFSTLERARVGFLVLSSDSLFLEDTCVLKAIAHPDRPTDEEKAEAVRLTLAGLGKAELELAGSYVSPLIWTVDGGNGRKHMKGGTVFFLDTGEAVFAVTAAHVVSEFFADSNMPDMHAAIAAHGKSPLRIPLGDRIIDASAEIDIATFRVSENELQYFDRNLLRGNVGEWPPRLAQVNGPATYCGFPGVGRRPVAGGVSFGAVPMGGIVTSSHETMISIQIEREELVRLLGDHDMPENFNFGGMSGGPLIAIVQAEIMRTWKPGGVIISGPNPGDAADQDFIPGFEVIRARPIHFIKADGALDHDRWAQANIR
jgi:hypothetical protein